MIKYSVTLSLLVIVKFIVYSTKFFIISSAFEGVLVFLSSLQDFLHPVNNSSVIIKININFFLILSYISLPHR